MPELFQDSFVEATDTDLTSHTPATGTAWTLQVGNSDAMRIESDDNTLRTNNGSLTTLVTSDDLGDTSCYVEATLGDFATQSNKNVAIRVQDEDNYIAWGIFGTGGGGLRLRKSVGGVVSNLIQTQGAAGVKYRIESEPGVLRFYGDGIQIGSDISDSTFDTETKQGLVTQSSAFGVSWLEDYAAGTLGGGGGITVTPSTINSVSASNNPAITFNSVVNLTPNTIDSLSVANNPSIQFSSVLNISPLTIDSASVSNDPIASFSAVLKITPQAIDSVSSTNNPSILFNSVLSLSPSTIDSLSVSNDPVIEFKSVINVLPQTIDSLSVSRNPFISFGVVQTIGNVTASFKDSGISVKYEEDEINVGYKPNAITVNFK